MLCLTGPRATSTFSPPFIHSLPAGHCVIAQTADFLSSVPLFRGLDRDEVAKFGELVRERSYPKGSVILFQDDPGDSLNILRPAA